MSKFSKIKNDSRKTVKRGLAGARRSVVDLLLGLMQNAHSVGDDLIDNFFHFFPHQIMIVIDQGNNRIGCLLKSFDEIRIQIQFGAVESGQFDHVSGKRRKRKTSRLACCFPQPHPTAPVNQHSTLSHPTPASLGCDNVFFLVKLAVNLGGLPMKQVEQPRLPIPAVRLNLESDQGFVGLHRLTLADPDLGNNAVHRRSNPAFHLH